MVAPKLPESPFVQAEPEVQEGRLRARTMSRKEMARFIRRRRLLGEDLDEDEREARELLEDRPKTRADCTTGSRFRPTGKEPCLFFGCKYNLYLDVNPETGSVKLNFPDKEAWELEDTCALDVADRGGITLEEVGAATNTTRERIRQVETDILLQLRAAVEGRSIEEMRANGDLTPSMSDDLSKALRRQLFKHQRRDGGTP